MSYPRKPKTPKDPNKGRFNPLNGYEKYQGTDLSKYRDEATTPVYQGSEAERLVNYDKTSSDPNYVSEEDLPVLDDIRAENQSTLSSLGNSFGKFVGKTGVNVIGGLAGTVYGASSAIANGDFNKLWDNDFLDAVDKADEALDNQFKVFKSADFNDQNIISKAIHHPLQFFDTATDALSFTAGAILTELATEGLGSGAIAAKATKLLRGLSRIDEVLPEGVKAAQLLSRLGTEEGVANLMKGGKLIKQLATGASFESMTEARQTGLAMRDKLYSDWQNSHPGQEMPQAVRDEIDDNLTKGSVFSYFTNLALVGSSNMIQFPKLFGLGYKSTKAAEGAIVRNLETGAFEATYKQAGKTPIYETILKGLKNPAEEGLVEEGLQGVINKTAQDYWGRKYDKTAQKDTFNFVKSLAGAFAHTYGTKQGWDDIGMGILIGGLGAPGGGLVGQRVESRDENGQVVSKRAPLWQGGVLEGFEEAAKEREHTDKLVENANKYGTLSDAMRYNYKYLVESKSLTRDMDDAVTRGDIFEFQSAKDDAIHSYVKSRLDAGYEESLDTDVENMSKMSTDDFYNTFRGEENGKNLTDKEKIDFKVSTIEQFKDRISNTKYANQVADNIYDGGNEDVKDTLVHAVAVAKNLDSRDREVQKSIIKITGSALGTINYNADNIPQVIQDVAKLSNLVAAKGEVTDEDIKQLNIFSTSIGSYAKASPIELQLNSDNLLNNLIDLYRIKNAKKNAVATYNYLFTEKGQKELESKIQERLEQDRKLATQQEEQDRKQKEDREKAKKVKAIVSTPATDIDSENTDALTQVFDDEEVDTTPDDIVTPVSPIVEEFDPFADIDESQQSEAPIQDVKDAEDAKTAAVEVVQSVNNEIVTIPTHPLDIQDLDNAEVEFKRTIGNTISYLAVDKADIKVNGKYQDKYVNGIIQLSPQLDTRLQSANYFKVGDTVKMIVPTLQQMQERGLDNYSSEDYARDINDINSFPIAFVDGNNKIVGYLPTRNGVDRLVNDNYKDTALESNSKLRENIFSNKNATYTTTITSKSNGNLLTNQIQQSLYKALGDGTKLASNIEIAVGKELSFRISPGTASSKNILNTAKDGVLYAILPTSNGGNIAAPIDINEIGNVKANTILQAILHNKDKNLAAKANIGEYDLTKGKDLLEFINNITYSTDISKGDKYLLQINGKKVSLGVTSDMVFNTDDLAASQELQDKFVNILSKRFSAVKLANFNKSYIDFNWNAATQTFESKSYSNYKDYLNTITRTNLQGFKVEGTDNEYFFTAQSVIGINDNTNTQEVIASETKVIEKKAPKKTMRFAGGFGKSNTDVSFNIELESKSAIDLYYVDKDIFSAQQQKEVVNTLIYQLNQIREENPEIKSVKELFNLTKESMTDMMDYIRLDGRDDIVDWDAEQRAADYLEKIVNNFDKFIPKVEQKLSLLGTSISSKRFSVEDMVDNSLENTDGSKEDAVINDTEALFQKLNYSDESSFAQSSKDTASSHMKQKLAFIPKYQYDAASNSFIEVPNSFGFPYYEDLDVVWGDLLRVFKGIPQNQIQSKLQELGNTNDRYKYIYNEIFNNSPVNLQKEFLVTFSKQQAEFVTIKINKQDAVGSKTIRVFGTNRAGASDIIVDSWYQNFLQSGIIETDIEGNKYINSELGKQLSSAYNLAIDHYGKDADRSLAAISSLFNKIGITLSPSLLIDQKQYKLREDGNNYTLEEWLKAKGKYIFDRLGGKFQIDSDDSLTLNNPFLDETSQLKTLASIELKYNPALYEGSFISGDGKAKYSYVNHTYLSHLFEKIQNDNDNEYVKALSKTAYASNSYWINSLINDPEFKKTFKLKYLDTLGSDATKANNKPFKQMTTKEKEFTRISLFQNQGTNVGAFISLIPSDKTTIPVVEHQKVKVKSVDGKVVNSEPVDRFMDIFKSEYARVALTLEQNKNGGAIAGYHDIKKTNSKGEEVIIPGMGSKFLTLDMFNRLVKDGSIELLDDNDFISIREEIKNYIDTLTTKQIEYWKGLGLYNDTILDKSYVKSTGLDAKANLEGVLNQLATDYAVNQFIHNFNYTQVVGGDPALHGKKSIAATWINYSKRMAKDIAPGLDPSFDNMKYNMIVLKDVEYKSDHYDEYLNILGEKAAKAYKEINAADAQEYTTLAEDLDLMRAMGKLTPEYEEAAKRLMDGGSLESDIELVLQPKKPVQVSSKIEDGINKIYYVKTSSFPLIPALTKGLELDKLRLFMESNNIQRAAYESGMKLGIEGNLLELGNINSIKDGLDINSTKVYQLDRSGFRVQQEIPYHGHDNTINEGSQGRKLVLNNLEDNDTINYNGEAISGKLAKEIYEKLHIEKYNRAFSKLKSDIGYNDVLGQFEDLSKLQQILKEEAESREYPLDDVYALQIVKDKNGLPRFKVPLGFIKNSSRLESILNSLVTNRVIKSELPGFAKVQGSNVAFNKNQVVNLDQLSADHKASIIWINPADTKLQYLREGGNGKNEAADILVPQFIRDSHGHKINIMDYMKEDGTIDLDKLSPDVLTIIGQRIPTQGYNSMMMFKVKGFLPEVMGDLAVVPAEITAQMGADFDVDKLFLYNYHHTVNADGKVSKVKFGGDVTSASDKELDNGIIQMFEDRLSDPRMLSQILEPNGFGALPELGKKLANKSDVNFMTSMAQNDIHKSNNDGKAGTGIFSLFSTFYKAAQDAKLAINDSFLYKDNEGNVKKLDNLYEPYSVTGSRRSSVISYFQSASVDNAKEQILATLNINSETMGIAGTMALLGYDEEFIGRFLSQPVLVDYVNLVANKTDLTNPQFNPQFDKEVFAELKDKYQFMLEPLGLAGDLDVKSLVDTTIEMPSLSIEDLKNNPDAIGILAMFSKVKKYADILRSVQAAINTDTNGLGARFVDMSVKKNLLENISGTELLIGLDRLFDNSLTTGKAIDILYQSSRMFGEILPYDRAAYANTVDEVMRLSGRDDKVSANDLMSIYGGIKSFILSSPSFIDNIQAERERLLFGTNSLARRWNEYALSPAGLKNILAKRIRAEIAKKEGEPDTLKSINTPASNNSMDVNDSTMRFIEMYEKGSDVEKGLARDMISYYLSTGAQFGANSISKYIPIDVLEQSGYSDKLRDVESELDNPGLFENVVQQIFQHNPKLALPIPDTLKDFGKSINLLETEAPTVKAKEGSNKIAYAPFVSKYDIKNGGWVLYKFDGVNGEQITYSKIDTLGSVNVAEFNYNEANQYSLIKGNKSGNLLKDSMNNTKQIDNFDYENNAVDVKGLSPTDSLKELINFNTGNAERMLDAIIANTTFPSYSRLAADLKATLVSNPTLKVVEETNGIYSGLYQASTNTLSLNFGAIADRYNNPREGVMKTFLHELLHAVTVNKINNYDNLSTKDKIIVNNINTLFKSYLNSVNQNDLVKFDSIVSKLANNQALTPDENEFYAANKQELYALQNVKEFIAAGLTDAKFVAKLKSGNFWTKFADLIKKLLGINVGNDFEALYNMSLELGKDGVQTSVESSTPNTLQRTRLPDSVREYLLSHAATRDSNISSMALKIDAAFRTITANRMSIRDTKAWKSIEDGGYFKYTTAEDMIVSLENQRFIDFLKHYNLLDAMDKTISQYIYTVKNETIVRGIMDIQKVVDQLDNISTYSTNMIDVEGEDRKEFNTTKKVSGNIELKQSPYQAFIDKVGYYPNGQNVKSVGVTFNSHEEAKEYLDNSGLNGIFVKEYMGKFFYNLDKPRLEVIRIPSLSELKRTFTDAEGNTLC